MSSKSEEQAAKPGKQKQQVATPQPKLTLTEFCMRVSETDKRVGILGAFEYTERAANRLSDTEAAYAERYKKFINQPA